MEYLCLNHDIEGSKHIDTLISKQEENPESSISLVLLLMKISTGTNDISQNWEAKEIFSLMGIML